MYRDRTVGAIGTLGCFSFYPTKNLGAFGDGGLVTTRDGSLARKIRALRQHGGEHRYHHDSVGGNFRLDALQAAVIRVKLPHLDDWSSARQRNARRYEKLFGEAGLSDFVALPARAPDRTHIYNQFVVRARNRDGLRAFLEVQGIGTDIYYPLPLHLQPCFRDLGYTAGDFPVSEAVSGGVLALPIYGELTEEQQTWVVEAIRLFYQRGA
jgi:dTDP-4-amino-4,6-dideoxygalactose transaminase